MADPRPTLLLTRPEGASRRFAGQFRARFGADWPVIIAPLMQTRWLAPPLDLTGCDGLVFTSETAVRALARLTDRRDLTAWCVGARTAQAAQDAGFSAEQGPGEAQGLAALLTERARCRRLLWPRGRDMAQDIAALVGADGPTITAAVVYAQDPLPLSPEALDCLSGPMPVLLPLFSPRSARLLAQAARPLAPLLVAAISPAVANAAHALNATHLAIAARPDGESLLDALGSLSHPGADG